MIIDLKALRQRGKTTAQFEFSYCPPSRLISMPGGNFIGDAKIVVNVEVYDDKAYVDGDITYGFSAACARCLTPVSVTRSIAFDELFLSERAMRSDDECYTYSRDRLDLTTMVDELILIDIPYAVYCKEDCKGLCPDCGKNLNDGPCGCKN